MSDSQQGQFDLGPIESPADPAEPLEPVCLDGRRVVRVLPDATGIERSFDYLIPEAWHDDGRADRVVVGSMVRVMLNGRRVNGWVIDADVTYAEAPRKPLAELVKLRSAGPPSNVIELADWASWRWAGRPQHFLRAASPERMVADTADPRAVDPPPSGPHDVFAQAFDHQIATIRVAPNDDGYAVALAACRLGDALIVTPDQRHARVLAVALRRAGIDVALAPDEWAKAAGGSTVVGTRSAAWMPMPRLSAVVILDEHDERLKEERTPAWHAREVAAERARRADVPLVMTSAVPSLEALRMGPLLRRDRSQERQDWPVVQLIDRRDEDPVRAGLFAEGLRSHIDGDRRVVCVLNRTGRSRLLACAACGELVRSEDGRSVMRLVGDELVSPDEQERRPVVCSHCGSTSLKNLRVGIERASEELAALVGEEVDEVTAATDGPLTRRVAIGTEAVLHRVGQADVVVFLDIDQELLAIRQRASEQAMGLFALAARVVGGRGSGGSIVVQTRQVDHEVLRAAVAADPAIVATAERDRRQPLGLPPYGFQVAISGAGGAELMENFGTVDGVQVRGPIDGRWLLRSRETKPVLDRLAEMSRPAQRVRIEVDPLRV